MNAVIYARYSCDNQREESIEGQLRECKEFAERKGIKLVGTYIDRAMSAKTDNRQQFQKMIKDSEKGLFDTVIVWKLDRFARNRYDSAHYKAVLRKHGAKVISATEVISEGAEGIILESVLEGYAEYYSAELSEKVIRGMTENALKCQYNGGPGTVGYIIDENKHYVIDPLVAPFIKEAFRMYADGYLIKDIVKYLNDKSVVSAYKKPMTKTSVTTMLSNCKYKGVYKYRDVEISDGVPRIVSDELFNRVQERLKKNKHSRSHFKAKEEYFLSSKLFCGDCGACMVGESGTGRGNVTYNYYKCSNAKNRKGCHKKAVRKDFIEEAVLLEVADKMFTEDMIDKIADKVMVLQDKEDTAIPLLKKELAETEKYIDNLIDAMQMGMLTKSTKQHLDELEARKEQLEADIINEEINSRKLSRGQVIDWLKKMKSLDLASDDNKRIMVDIFVNSVYLYDDRMVVSFNCREKASILALPDGCVSDGSSLGEPRKNLAFKPFARFFLCLSLNQGCVRGCASSTNTMQQNYIMSQNDFDSYSVAVGIRKVSCKLLSGLQEIFYLEEIQMYEYYYGTEAEQFNFIKIPRAFFTDKERFGTLSNEAKIMYSLLLDRMNLSMKNGWLDEHNRVYIIYTIDEIAETMGCGTNLAVRILKELDDENGVGLIHKKRRGFGLPTLIYVKKLFVGESSERKKAEKSSECSKSEFISCENENSEVCKNNTLECSKGECNYTYPNKTDMSYTDNQSFTPAYEQNFGMNEKIDRTEIEEFVKLNIDYDCLMSNDDESIRGMVEEIKEIIVDVLCGERSVYAGGKKISDEAAKAAFGRLTSEHILFALHNVLNNPNQISQIDKYIAAVLYNASHTFNLSTFSGFTANTGLKMID